MPTCCKDSRLVGVGANQVFVAAVHVLGVEVGDGNARDCSGKQQFVAAGSSLLLVQTARIF
jgi:hypothetical protein